MAKETEDSSTVDTGKACSIGESRECKYSYYTSATTADRVHAKHDPYAIEVDCGWNCYSCGILVTLQEITEIGKLLVRKEIRIQEQFKQWEQ